MNIQTIKFRSQWMASKDMSIGIGSHSTNPNTTSLQIPQGTILTWDDDAPNGNVWFYVTIYGKKYRGKVECGRITNLIKRGTIELFNEGNGPSVYSGDYLKRLLS
jgi:hypothetical protein